MPLTQYEVAREIGRELSTEPVERTSKIVVQSFYLSNTWGRKISAIRVFRIIGSSILEQICGKL
jgi:hypothetical protein